MRLFFPQAVELRLRKIHGCLTQDIVTAAQFADFALQLFQTMTLGGIKPAITRSGLLLIVPQPDAQGFRGTADFLGNRLKGCPL